MKLSMRKSITLFIIIIMVCLVIPVRLIAINSTDGKGTRVGKWIIYLDKNLTTTQDSIHYPYYKVANYVSGRPIGYVNYYYKSGKLYFQTPVRSLDPDVYVDGEVKYFSENGDKLKVLNYYMGQLEGPAVYYYPDGKPQFQGNFTDGKRSGIWKQWDKDGNYGIGSYANDVPEGQWTFYYADGSLKSEGRFHNGVQTGVWAEYRENGDIAEGSFTNGKPDGTWVCRYKNEKPCFIGSYSNGLRDGFWQEWDIMGRLSKGSYINDKKEGAWVLLDAYGNKLIEGNYLSGKEEGTWNRYDNLGNIIETSLYKDGEKIK